MNLMFNIPIVYGTAFTHEIIKHVMLNTSAKEKNLVFSPYLILAALSQIAAGSKGSVLEKMLSHVNSGSTREHAEFCSQLVREMFSDWNLIGGKKVWFCTSTWIDKSLPVDPVFKNAVETVYNHALNQVDFRKKAKNAAAKMNFWAEEVTGGQIRKAFPPSAVNRSTRLAFLNAIFFKGIWMRKIDPADTKVDDFHLLDGSSVRVPFMTSKTRQYIGVFKGFKVLRLSYYCGTLSGLEDLGRISMNILLPDSKNRFASLVRNFCAEAGFLERHHHIQLVEIGKLKIPRFKIAYGFEACQTLKDLAGSLLPSSMSTTEDEDPTAKMTDDGTSATRIIHSSVLEINEESMGESAETEWLLANVPASLRGKVDFVADHPFMFVIRDDKTGVTMLTGHVLNPIVC